jgi:hypothetical protein
VPGQEQLELFAKYGGLIGLLMGVIIFISVGTNYLLWKRLISAQNKLDEVQEKRVSDAKEVGKGLLEQAGDYNKALTDTGTAVTALRDAVLLRDRDRR